MASQDVYKDGYVSIELDDEGDLLLTTHNCLIILTPNIIKALQAFLNAEGKGVTDA